VVEVNVVLGSVKMGSEGGRQITLRSTQFEKVEGKWQVREG
jgi:hypothetical protein